MILVSPLVANRGVSRMYETCCILFIHVIKLHVSNSLHRVLCLSECCHDFHTSRLAGELLDLGVLQVSSAWEFSLGACDGTYVESHEDIVFLIGGLAFVLDYIVSPTYLLVTNSELALSLLVGVREGLQLLDGLRLQDLDAELDVALGVFMAGLRKMSILMPQNRNMHEQHT